MEAYLPARNLLLGTVAALCLFLAACDKPAESAPAPSPAVPPTPVAPSAQDQPPKKLSLINIPIVLSVPADWKVEPPNNPAYLEGAGPDGQVQISLSLLDSMTGSSRKAYIETALSQSQRHPHRIQIRQITTDNGLQIFERINYTDLPDDPADQAQPATRPSEPLSWTLVLFVPVDQKFIPCQFDLLKLTQKQYEDDRQFIESMVETSQAGNLSAFR
jgi:hypothetical protein